jgi:hypothetical protein
MGKVFQNHVHVSNPETGQAQWFAPGDKAPDWTEGYVDDANFVEEGSEAAEAFDSTVDYTKLKKDELVTLAEDRGIDASGTKEDIIGRLEEADAALG